VARPIAIRYWYPVDPSVAQLYTELDHVSYRSSAAYFNGSFTSYGFTALSTGFPLLHSLYGAIRGAPHASLLNNTRLVMLLHGANGRSIFDYLTGEFLATHGFAVVALDSAGGATYGAPSLGTNAGQVLRAVSVTESAARSGDVRAIVDYLFAQAALGTNPLFSRILNTTFGCLGSSAGSQLCTYMAAGAPGLGVVRDSRLGAAVCLGNQATPSQATVTAGRAFNVTNVVIPMFFAANAFVSNTEPMLSASLDQLHFDTYINVPSKYLLTAPGFTHGSSSGSFMDCDFYLSFMETTLFGTNTTGFSSNVLGAREILKHCGCSRERARLLAFPSSFWAADLLGITDKKSAIEALVEASPTSSYPLESYRNLMFGYVNAFLQRHLVGNVAYQAYLTNSYAVATFPSVFATFFANALPPVPEKRLDVVGGSMLQFEPSAHGYLVRYWPVAPDGGLITHENGSYGNARVNTGALNHQTLGPNVLAMPGGFPLPGPTNRLQRGNLTTMFYEVDGLIWFGPRKSQETDDVGTALYTEGFLRQYGQFVIAPLHTDLFQDVAGNPVTGPGIFLRNEAEFAIVTWDRLRSRQDRSGTLNTVQAVLCANGTIQFRYGATLSFNNTGILPTIYSLIAAIGVSDGRGLATEGGQHHAVDFTSLLTPTYYSLGSIYEIFRNEYHPLTPSELAAYYSIEFQNAGTMPLGGANNDGGVFLE
jgi:hypothetical protein